MVLIVRVPIQDPRDLDHNHLQSLLLVCKKPVPSRLLMQNIFERLTYGGIRHKISILFAAALKNRLDISTHRCTH